MGLGLKVKGSERVLRGPLVAAMEAVRGKGALWDCQLALAAAVAQCVPGGVLSSSIVWAKKQTWEGGVVGRGE